MKKRGVCGSDPCQVLECDKKCKQGVNCRVESCAVREKYYATEGSKCDDKRYCHQGNCITSKLLSLSFHSFASIKPNHELHHM